MSQALDQRIERVLDILNFDAACAMSTVSLARQMNICPRHLARLFRRQKGQCIRDYLHEMRLRRAAGLLSQTQVSIKEIAARVGITDPSNFTRAFKAAYGVPPREYRSRAKQLSAQPSENH